MHAARSPTPNRRARPAALAMALALGGAPACSGGGAAADVRQAMAQWEEALREGDKARLRRLVTSASRPFVDHLPVERAASSGPLSVSHVRVDAARAVVRVQEAGGSLGAFVLRREDGAWRVDLVDTAGINSRELALPGPPRRWRWEPAEAAAPRTSR